MVLRYAFSTSVPHSTEDAALGARRSAGPAAQSVHAELLDTVDSIWTELTATSTYVSDLVGVPADAPTRRQLRLLIERRNKLLRTLIAERRAERRERRGEGGRDMLDVLLAAELPEDDILYTLVDLFVAGVNTVASTIEWTLLMCAEHPIEQQRARAHALRDPSGSSATSAAAIEALTNEVLRAKPPLLIPRLAVCDTSVGGFIVPEGHVVYANSWALTQSERHWLEPSAFRPQRWLEEEAAPWRGAEACKFLPFSVGRRLNSGDNTAAFGAGPEGSLVILYTLYFIRGLVRRARARCARCERA